MRGNRTISYFSAQIKKLPQLTQKEKDILVKRLAFSTLEKIGDGFDVTEGRIRQIEKKAIAKIKSKTPQLSLFKKIIEN